MIEFRQNRLTRSLDRYRDVAGTRARRAIVEELDRGLRRGDGPPVVARRITKRIRDVALGRAMTIARTELMVAVWDRTRRDFRLDRTVTGWKWLARLDGRTCLICRAMHGTAHTVEERIESHPNCRCAMSPIVQGVDPLNLESGEAQFRSLPASEQRRILGPGRYAQYQRSGSLGSMLGRTTHPVYGGGRVIRPVPAGPRIAGARTTPSQEARRLLARVRSAEPRVTAAMRASATRHGGTLQGLEHRLKQLPSLTRKIRNDVADSPGLTPRRAAAATFDAYRYTVRLPVASYSTGVRSTLSELQAQGYTVLRTKNFWRDSDRGYAAIQTVLRAPNGTTFEVQFHTRGTLAGKDPSHKLYGVQRNIPRTDPRYDALGRQMDAIWNPIRGRPPPGVAAIPSTARR